MQGPIHQLPRESTIYCLVQIPNWGLSIHTTIDTTLQLERVCPPPRWVRNIRYFLILITTSHLSVLYDAVVSNATPPITKGIPRYSLTKSSNVKIIIP